MNFVKRYNHFFQNYFPSPLSIAILLTFISFTLAFFLTRGQTSPFDQVQLITTYWYAGLFKSSLLEFTVHMMLILLLGHVIALSKPISKLIDNSIKYCTNTASAAFFVSFFTILVSLFNWGFGLVFGAIFARKIGEKFQKESKSLNYPLVAVAAYVGMMVWHGGLSGSAPLTVAGVSHSYVNEIGVIPLSRTVFSSMNITTTLVIILVLPLLFYWFGRKTTVKTVPQITLEPSVGETDISSPADRFERKNWFGRLVGALLLTSFAFFSFQNVHTGDSLLSILNLQSTNLLLLGLAFFLQGNIKNFLSAVNEAIKDLAGIIIQFPLYFGIMGIIQGSGLAEMIAGVFISISNEFTLPIFTYLSAGMLNVFIPSGGGQWQVQAPIIIASAKNSGIAIEKLIMAMSYGDQLTNMLQPFWALPLLGITQLKAKDILPYSLLAFVVGFFVFLLAILIF